MSAWWTERVEKKGDIVSSVKRWALTIIVVATISGIAHADSAAPDSANEAPKPLKKEESVDPTGLIIAGVALAAFAVLFLIGRSRKRQPQSRSASTGELAEVHLVIESDDRVTVWNSPSLKLQTDRLGEVVLHLPVGAHDVHMQVGSELYTRTIHVTAVKRTRIPINIAKERISRTASGEQPALAAPAGIGLGNKVPDHPLFGDLGRPQQKAPTSNARAFPDSATQGYLGAQLAGLIDVELDAPKAAKPFDLGLDPHAVELSPSAPARSRGATNPPLKLDFGTPAPVPGNLDLDGDLDIPVTYPTPDPGATSLPPPPARPSPLRDVAAPPQPVRHSPLADVPARSRPQTGPLEGIPQSGRTRAPSSIQRPALEISLDEIAPIKQPLGGAIAKPAVPPFSIDPPKPLDLIPPPRPAASGPTTELDLDDLGPSTAPAPVAMEMPKAAAIDLAPPTRAPAAPAPSKTGVPSVMDFALDDMVPAPPRPVEQMPKVSAASVADLQLDEDSPVNRIASPPRTSSRPMPSLDEFTLEDDIPLDGPRPVAPMPKPLPMPRPATPIESAPPLTRSARPSKPPGIAGALAGRYRKLAPIGPGPSGLLYRGRDEAATRDVLIEELPPEVTLSGNAQALAGLNHANIVCFHEHVTEGGIGYVISELVEGKTLKQLLAERGGTLASLEAIGIVDQVCAALAYAHERGVFHRAVRPSCIVMAGRTVKVAAFGMTLGANTTEYTAPEVLLGATAEARADLYSIGVVLAELLTGAIPVAGKLMFPSDVPRNLASLVRKLLSREPTIRPATTKAVREAFSSVF